MGVAAKNMAFLVEIRKTHPCCLLAEMNYNFRDDTYTVSTTRSVRNTTPDVAKRPKTGIFERHLYGERHQGLLMSYMALMAPESPILILELGISV